MLIKVLRKVVRLIVKTIPKLPAILEIELQHVQGKGSGSGTTEVEAKMALNFISWSKTNKLVVLDIGANIGFFTHLFLKKSGMTGKIYSFESKFKLEIILFFG